MASTHAPSEALNYAKTMIKYGNLTDTNIAYQILDEASKIIWYAAPWSWTVAAMTTQTLVAATTDYTIATPADFEFIYKAVLIDSGNIKKNLKIEPILPSDSIKTGETISCNYSGTTFRVYPKPPATLPATTQKILILYKKTAPEIASGNYTSTGVHILPDRWWHVYKHFVLSLAYLYGDDDRAMNLKINPRTKDVEMSGHQAYCQYLLNEMRLKEPMPFEWETFQENVADNR
jgi:hypothetical protein